MVVNVPLGSIYNTHSMLLYDARISNGLNFSYDNVLKVKENETHAMHFLPKFSDMLTLSQSKADYAQPVALPHPKFFVVTHYAPEVACIWSLLTSYEGVVEW